MTHDGTNEASRARCPETVLGWIPWYADGGLTARQRGAVEAHAAECRECRSELDIVAGAPGALDGVELPDADRLFDEITARLDADEPRAGDRAATEPPSANVIPISRGRALSGEDVARIERWVLDPGSELDLEEPAPGRARAAATIAGSEPRRPFDARARERGGRAIPGRSPLLAAAAALVLMAVGALGGTALEQLRAESEGSLADDTYHLSSLPTSAAPAPAVTPSLDVVFDDDATAGAISSRLRELGVEIVAGPTNLGVYRLRLTQDATHGRVPSAADAAAIAARLVDPGERIAIFAEPVP